MIEHRLIDRAGKHEPIGKAKVACYRKHPHQRWRRPQDCGQTPAEFPLVRLDIHRARLKRSRSPMLAIELVNRVDYASTISGSKLVTKAATSLRSRSGTSNVSRLTA